MNFHQLTAHRGMDSAAKWEGSDQWTTGTRARKLIASASARLEVLRRSLPDSTSGMMEFCLMLHLIQQSLPSFTQWVRSPTFMESFAMRGFELGCPEFNPDEAEEMLKGLRERVN